MSYQRSKIALLAFIAVTAGVMVAGIVVASTGHKDIADRFLGPALLMSFGLTVTVAICLNYRYVGWARGNWSGDCSRTHRRFAYLAGIALATLAGIACIVGGILLLLVKSSK